MTEKKKLDITDVKGAKKNIPDLKVFGEGDIFRLISKASSEAGGWMKSTKAMEVPGLGCVIQVSTQQGDNVAEALTFVPGAIIVGDGKNRKLVSGAYATIVGTNGEIYRLPKTTEGLEDD